MKKALLLALSALAGCGIDERRVELNAFCREAAEDGTIADFSGAEERGCPAGYCIRDWVGITAVTLGEGADAGLVYPYAGPGLIPALLDVKVSEPVDDAAPARALRIVLDTGGTDAVGIDAANGFALRFVDCVDTSAFSSVSFRVDSSEGTLGACPLRFAPQFLEPHARTFDETLPLDAYSTRLSVPLREGETTLDFAELSRASGSSALAGMQWEVEVPNDEPGGCSAFFTLDDVRLTR